MQPAAWPLGYGTVTGDRRIELRCRLVLETGPLSQSVPHVEVCIARAHDRG